MRARRHEDSEPCTGRLDDQTRARHRAYSGHDRHHSPIISPEALFAGLARPDLRIVDVRWVLELARRRPGGLRGRAHPGRDLPRPRYGPRRARAARGAIPSPTPATSGSGSRRPGSARRTRSSPTTTPRGATRPGCGGCSTISATSASRCSTAAIRAWLAAGYPVTHRPPPEPAPAAASSCATPGRNVTTATPSRPGSARWCCWTRGPRRAISARSNRSTGSPATSRPPRSAPVGAATSGPTGACSARRPSRRGSATSGATSRTPTSRS